VAVLALVLLVPGLVARAANDGTITGVVTDERGEPVAGATVSFVANGQPRTTTTDRNGRFVVETLAASTGTLAVRAEGFAPVELAWDPGVSTTLTLRPAPFDETIVVTADRTATRVGDTATSVVTLTRRDLDTSAAVTLDAALRQVPGFQLFRRTDSRAANPTAQGASLRGVAPSGASRTVVMVDGVPLNDPFGGWVYWSRVPSASIDRVEVARGGASSLYGSDALGGVVQVLTARPSSPAWLSVEASAGSMTTSTASLAGGLARDGWTGSLAAEAFDTDGYVLVDEDERGPVDTPAGAQHGTLAASLERRLSAAARAFVRGSVFREDRANGTPLQTNRTHVRELVAGIDWTSALLGAFALRAYGGAQVYDQTFSAVAADRASEALTRLQRVPAQQLGASIGWQRPLAERHTLLAGLETREVRGASDELGYFGGAATSASGSGGRQRTVGVYGQGIFHVTEALVVAGGVRVDWWRNYDALSTTRLLSSPGASVREFDERTETAVSPRASLLYAVTPRVSLTASAYRAFRAPTLNELYRGFRVGNVVTLANADLQAERLTGGEAGARVDAFDGRLAARATVYWSEVTRPVANVTLSVTPELITRIRQNLGRTRARGVEVDVEARLGRDFEVTGGYAYADSTVLEFEANPHFEGLRVPQVPRHYGSVQARYSAPWRLTLAAVGRFSSSQYDDDQNRLELGGYGTLDVFASRAIGSAAEVFVAGENVFDTRYEVGKTPVTTVGPPASVRAGVRLRLR
jgi:outer membrane receptor protein involved in Fe transport